MEHKKTSVICLPANTDASQGENKKARRAAAYARVSTSKADQLNSLEAQTDFYENYIKRHVSWEFCGLYAD